jgi:hypothetical protein
LVIALAIVLGLGTLMGDPDADLVGDAPRYETVVCRPSGRTSCVIPVASIFANRGHNLRLIQDYLDRRNPKHTVQYTRTAGSRFDGLRR